MAQEVNARPVILEQGQGAQYFAESLANIAAQKSAQQKAIRDAELARDKDLYDLLGDSSKKVIEYYDKASTNGGRDIINAELSATLKNLATGIKDRKTDPSLAREYSIGVIADASQRAGRISDFFAGVNKKAEEYAAQGFDPNAIKAYVGKAIETGGGLNADTISKIGDPSAFIDKFVSSDITLFANRAVTRDKANKDVETLLKEGKDTSTNLEMDPTGKKTFKLGTKGFATVFDEEIEEVDPVTGLKFNRPVLKKEDISFINATRKGLPEDSYNLLISKASPITRNEIIIGAAEKIKENNKRALQESGYPADTILTITQDNVGKWMDRVPGFINPFNDGEVEKFKRVYALDLIQGSGAYSEDGKSKRFSITNRGVNAIAPPKNITNINMPGQPGTYVEAWDNLNDMFKGARNITSPNGKTVIGKALNSFPQDYAEIFVTAVNKVSKKPAKDAFTPAEPYTQEDLVLVKDKNGDIIVKAHETGAELSRFKKGTFDKAYNGGVSQKAKEGATLAAEKENKQPTKTISKDAFKKMSITERQRFRSSGGKVE